MPSKLDMRPGLAEAFLPGSPGFPEPFSQGRPAREQAPEAGSTSRGLALILLLRGFHLLEIQILTFLIWMKDLLSLLEYFLAGKAWAHPVISDL